MPQRPDRVRRQWRVPAAAPVGLALVVCAGLLVFVATSTDDAEPTPTPTTTAATTATTESTTTTTEPPPDPIDIGALTVEPLPEDPPAAARRSAVGPRVRARGRRGSPIVGSWRSWSGGGARTVPPTFLIWLSDGGFPFG